jgi:hypothetical protein
MIVSPLAWGDLSEAWSDHSLDSYKAVAAQKQDGLQSVCNRLQAERIKQKAE